MDDRESIECAALKRIWQEGVSAQQHYKCMKCRYHCSYRPKHGGAFPKKTGAVMKHFLHQFVQLCHLAGRPGMRRLKQR
ncbi:hypothetical protein JFK97_07260 [Chromobacterium phragmitis]|uniref:hypothetical protein n=1 Tax=Chromobacterium amazonense TaxID=1382803 RepID=UPI0021B7A10B|nr:hypothetical protein [Chromobacterium amazonense]MBM2884187.1 hypothetical protein [Chromobacterium amazonense]MDE1711549.1 hypothetical protein [Chromobacterium amazonense]